MNIVIEIYVFICIMLLLFDIGFLIVKNKKRLDFYKKNKRFEKEIYKHFEKFEKEGVFSRTFIEDLRKKIRDTRDLIILQNIVEANPAMKKAIILYVFEKFDDYKRKSNYEQAFYLNVLSTLDYTQPVIRYEDMEKLIYFLDSKFLYTFVNAMEAIYKFGNVNLMLVAIDKIDERKGFYNKKLFVDGLLTFEGDFQELSQLLINRFSTYQNETKENILAFFRLKGVEVSDLCMNLLKHEETVDEVKYAAMRYFFKFPSEESKEVFLKILHEPEILWVEQLLAIQGLKNYTDTRIRNMMMEKITDVNWYIRVNASEYLYKQAISKEEIFKILERRDRYANEILIYQYRHSEQMTKYITDSIQVIGDVTAEQKADKPRHIVSVSGG